MTKIIKPLFTLIFICLLSQFQAQAQTIGWVDAGNRNIANSIDNFDFKLNSQGVPYIAFRDVDSTDQGRVMKLINGVWTNVGPRFLTGYIIHLSLTIGQNDTPFIAYSGDSSLTVKKFDGTNWVNVGASGFLGFGEGELTNKNGTLYITSGSGASRESVMKFDGSNWVYVGSSNFSVSMAFDVSIAVDASGTPYVSYDDAGASQHLYVKKFNGSSWVDVGTPNFVTDAVAYTSLAIDATGTPYVAFTNAAASNKANVMKYNGTSWSYVGSANFSTGGAAYLNLTLSNTGTPYLTYTSNSQGNITVAKKFDGTNWVDVGPVNISEGNGAVQTSIQIAPNNDSIYVAYIGNTGKPRVKVLASTVNLGPVATTACIGAPVYVPYTVRNNPGLTVEVFTAQLSDINGSFANPLAIGSNISATSGLIYSTIPSGTPPGNTYRIRVVSSAGDSSADNGTNISINPLPDITLSNNIAVCINDSLSLNASSSQSNLSFSWTGPATISNAGSSNAFVLNTQPANAGTYKVVVLDTLTTCKDSATTVVTVNPLPFVSITPSTDSFTACGSKTLMGTAPASTHYFWSNSSGLISGATQNTYNAVNNGATSITDTYTFTAVDTITGCRSLNQGHAVTLTLNVIPPATATATGDTSFCLGGSVTITTDTGLAYKWLKNNSLISNATGQDYMASATGTYRVITSNGLCFDTSSSVSVNALPLPDTTLTLSGTYLFDAGKITICANEGSVDLEVNAGGISQYQWYANGILDSANNSSRYHVNTQGTYTLIAIGNNGCVDSVSRTIYTHNITAPVIQVNDSLLTTGTGYAGYQWLLNGHIIIGAEHYTYTATQDGSYLVIVNDNLGCIASSDTVTITKLAVNSPILKSDIKLYPNPATSNIEISSAQKIKNVCILNNAGEQVYQHTENADHISLNISNLAAGFYFIRINDTIVKKFEKL